MDATGGPCWFLVISPAEKFKAMKPGDKVVCIKTSTKWGTVKDKVYEIIRIKHCRCGKISIDVGVRQHSFYFWWDGTTVCKCGERSYSKEGPYKIVWQKAVRFRVIDEDQYLRLKLVAKLEETLEGERDPLKITVPQEQEIEEENV